MGTGEKIAQLYVRDPPTRRKASENPMDGGWIELSSIKIRNPKPEIRNKFK
jgi:hypothetical protein